MPRKSLLLAARRPSTASGLPSRINTPARPRVVCIDDRAHVCGEVPARCRRAIRCGWAPPERSWGCGREGHGRWGKGRCRLRGDASEGMRVLVRFSTRQVRVSEVPPLIWEPRGFLETRRAEGVGCLAEAGGGPRALRGGRGWGGRLALSWGDGDSRTPWSEPRPPEVARLWLGETNHII